MISLIIGQPEQWKKIFGLLLAKRIGILFPNTLLAKLELKRILPSIGRLMRIVKIYKNPQLEI